VLLRLTPGRLRRARASGGQVYSAERRPKVPPNWVSRWRSRSWPLHKSDGGGVQLSLVGGEAVAEAYGAMQKAFGQDMVGALVQPMAGETGVETMWEACRTLSSAPGPVGLGGVSVEVLGDHVTRLAR